MFSVQCKVILLKKEKDEWEVGGGRNGKRFDIMSTLFHINTQSHTISFNIHKS